MSFTSAAENEITARRWIRPDFPLRETVFGFASADMRKANALALGEPEMGGAPDPTAATRAGSFESHYPVTRRLGSSFLSSSARGK